MNPKKIVIETSSGKLSLAQGSTTVGRSRSCGIRLDDLSASRNHVLLSRSGDRVTVKDLESSNGTFLNGERLEREEELQPGDVIVIGESELRFTVLADVPDPGSETVYAAPDLSTRYVPRPTLAQPSPSEAVAVGDALPVGEVLAQSQPGWKSTGVLPLPPEHNPGSGELLPSIEDIERQLAAQERSARPPQGPSVPLQSAPGKSAQPHGSRLPPAGFFRRFLAQLIDGALAMLVAVAASFAAGGPLDPTGGVVMSLAALVLGIVFHVFGWTMAGASPGKKLLGLAVCDDQGRVGLSFGRALLRYAGYMVSSLPLGAGFLIPLFHPQKKALHDLIAGTYVGRR